MEIYDVQRAPVDTKPFETRERVENSYCIDLSRTELC